MSTLSASEFKARCLAVLAEVARTGESVVVLKRGRPVVRIVPATPVSDEHPQEALEGTLEIVGDVIEPVLPPEAWEAERG